MTEKVTKERCAERVRDAQTRQSYNCQRPAGYGEGAAYCKQHARKHPSAAEVAGGVVKYWAEWGQYGYPALARVMVISETDKTFATTREGKVDLIGSVYLNLSGTVKKEDGLLTDSLEAACEWIENKAALRVLAASNALDRARGDAIEVHGQVKRVMQASKEVAQEVQGDAHKN